MSEKKKPAKKAEKKKEKIVSKYRINKPNGKTIDRDANRKGIKEYYESKGWMVGKNKMKDWKACIRTWKKETIRNQQCKS